MLQKLTVMLYIRLLHSRNGLSNTNIRGYGAQPVSGSHWSMTMAKVWAHHGGGDGWDRLVSRDHVGGGDGAAGSDRSAKICPVRGGGDGSDRLVTVDHVDGDD